MHKQLIPYVVVRDAGRVFLMHRTDADAAPPGDLADGQPVQAWRERRRAVLAFRKLALGGIIHLSQHFVWMAPAAYVRTPTGQEQSLFTGERSRYLVVYPFTKDTDWYLLSKEARQGIMNEHMRVGHEYPSIRQALAYSFGLDSQDFVVAQSFDQL